MAATQPEILITGATGYIGGRLLGRFEERGVPVRAMARTPEHLQPRVGETTRVVGGDIFEPESLREALQGVDIAYYLIHSLGAGGDFESREAEGACNFAEAARAAGVRRIIYLGGLGHGDELSAHLRSRQTVGRILRESGVPTLEFRASIIIGSGSVSFSLFRSLVERLPVMITPRWVRSKAQPISVEDVLDYLEAGVEVELPGSTVVEIGGADQVSYEDMMREYARQRGLRRVIIPVPLLSPSLSSRWLSLVTPLYAPVGSKLIEGVRNDTVVESPKAREMFDIEPRGIEDAIARALVNEERRAAETRWSDALSARDGQDSYGGVHFGQRIVDSRSLKVRAAPDQAFAPIRRIGGRVGWYYGDWLWRIRGFLDNLVGGVGLRRGRRDPENIFPGEAIDFWRVEAIEPDRLLRMRAEMRLPGRAWLQFEVEEVDGGSRIRQTAIFDPRGLSGLLYWYALYPVHQLVFKNMLLNIARAIPRYR